jgi:ectoine hydroxylase-related dioxygenase (phytanoyl-CoA dioxygenase family)
MPVQVLTDAQRIAFETNGFLTIENALDEAELRGVRAAADRVEQTWRADPSLPGIRKPELEEVITPGTHAGWHHDVGLRGVYHPLSVLMVKVFYLLSDVNADSGGTAMIPGSHRLPMDFAFPAVDDPKQMPGAVQMTGRAGTAYLFNGRVYHCAVNNESDHTRRVLIYNYGHLWMKVWPLYEPSERLLQEARASGDPVRMQLLGIGHPYSAHLKD